MEWENGTCCCIQTASHRYRGKGPQGTIALAFFLSCGGGLLRIRQTDISMRAKTDQRESAPLYSSYRENTEELSLYSSSRENREELSLYSSSRENREEISLYSSY